MTRLFSALQPSNIQKMEGYLLLAASIAAAALGQNLLSLAVTNAGFWEIASWLPNFWKNSSPLPGLVLYAFGGWMFVGGIKHLEVTPARLKFSTLETPHPKPQFGFWVTSLGLAAITCYSAAQPTANSIGTALAFTWLLNITLFTITVLVHIKWQPPSIQDTGHWVQAHFLELLSIAILGLLAFAIRFWNLELQPYSFVNDEGQMGSHGVCAVLGSCTNLFAMGWAGQPVLAFVPTGISIALLGRSATAVRLVSVLIGTLAVIAVYLVAREIFEKKVAFTAAALLASLPLHVHFSRLGVDNIVDSLSTTLILGLLFGGMKRGSTLNFLAAGILGGVCIYTYPGTRLAPVLGFTAICFICLRTRGLIKAHLPNIAIFVMAGIITAAPMIGFFSANPNYFASRMNNEGIFQNSTVASGLQNGNSMAGILTNQFMRSSLVYIITPAPLNFFNSPQPYLTPLAAVFFMLGLAYTFCQIKEDRYFVIFIWFWAAIILGSTLTGGPPSSQRMLMSTPGLAILTAIGINKALEILPGLGKSTRWIQAGGLLLFIICVMNKDVNFYFNEYQQGHFFEDRTNELTYETAAKISPLHDKGRFYILSEPGVPYLSFPNFNFFSPDVEKAYFYEVTRQSVDNLPKDKNALFIATPSRLEDLKKLANMIPGGEWNDIPRRYQPADMLYYSYAISQHILQAYKP